MSKGQIDENGVGGRINCNDSPLILKAFVNHPDFALLRF